MHVSLGIFVLYGRFFGSRLLRRLLDVVAGYRKLYCPIEFCTLSKGLFFFVFLCGRRPRSTRYELVFYAPPRAAVHCFTYRYIRR